MAQQRTIELHVTLTESEVFWANLVIQLGKNGVAGVLLYAVSILFLGGMVWKLLSTSESEILADLAPVIGWIAVPLLLVSITVLPIYLTAKIAVRRNPKMMGPCEYLISATGMELRNEFARSEVQWATFVQIRETKKMFLFFMNPRLAQAVPKRCFSSNAEIAELRDLLRENYRGKLGLRSA